MKSKEDDQKNYTHSRGLNVEGPYLGQNLPVISERRKRVPFQISVYRMLTTVLRIHINR